MEIKLNDNEKVKIISSTGQEFEVWADNIGELRRLK